MPRVLVALDGSEASASILPEAIRLAGRDGELVLIHDVGCSNRDEGAEPSRQIGAVEASETYLHDRVAELRASGVRARSETFVMSDPAQAIDEGARIFEADFIACATEARSGFLRVLRPSIAWSALAHSPVPVMLRRSDQETEPVDTTTPRILVPLDGSPRAEAALPFAQDLAQRWRGSLLLVQVLPELVPTERRFRRGESYALTVEQEERDATSYLEAVAEGLGKDVSTMVTVGAVAQKLSAVATSWASSTATVSHVVMASHGRTGLRRVILGSIADDLIHELRIPIIVVPAFASVPARARPETRELVPA
jgi:nucleotide-binding universal stress UspA family protein